MVLCSQLIEGLGAYSDINTVIREDEGGVGGCKLGGRHCVRLFSLVVVVEI